MEPRVEWDAVVVGGGPAGLAAAMWLGRYRRKALVLDAGEHRNRWTQLAHGYLSRDPVAPDRLRSDALSQLRRYRTVEVREARVERAERDGERFVLHGAGAHRARKVVLATGVVDRFPDVTGFQDHYGRSVFHCPSCDGFEARGCEVVVIGWSADVAGFTLQLLDWASGATVVTDGRTFEGDAPHRAALEAHGIRVVERHARELVGEPGRLEGLRLAGGELLSCQMAFFSIAHHPQVELAEQLGCALDDDRHVKVDDKGLTSVAGVYAAGDLTPGTQLVQIAAAKGATAGICCAVSLRGEPPVAGAPPRAPDSESAIEQAAGP